MHNTEHVRPLDRLLRDAYARALRITYTQRAHCNIINAMLRQALEANGLDSMTYASDDSATSHASTYTRQRRSLTWPYATAQDRSGLSNSPRT